ncbi:sensor histidine kinase [Mucilaginibacter sp. FT3.2]|uniref:sensor histidine kinase n=1 Tax=Mucilaginibacter sp. FT3.2 TaxID=2723090 RepID=UPI001610D5AC|nr:histidine kinase [Mucilaginibacter sp. FT3.2]MBB6229753.1 sensor histidine kinase YesM [Mucilaginibacter sp. FT3.2]
MNDKLPLARLSRLTWLQAIIIGFIFYLVASHSGETIPVIQYTVLTMSGILLVGYADISLMIALSLRFSIRSRKFSVYRRLLTYAASVLIYLLLRPAFSYVTATPWSFWDAGTFLAFVGSGIVINTLITLLHDSVLLYEHKLYSELELSRLQASNAEARNLVLKQQIQPHFLFNSLNTLKALYNKDAKIGDDYIVHMANFLRASIFHHASNIATVEEEIRLLTDYLEMQKIRFGAAMYCTIELSEGTLKNLNLPSFSLQPLLENAIKHNNFTQESPLFFRISQQGEWLVISNNLQKKKTNVTSTNYGLANLSERYRLLSGDEIRIKEDYNSFSVSIKLLKDEDNNH